jgi:4-amino-4-deoxychorismate lyase
MSLLFETIRISGGVPMHLGWHNLRVNRSRNEFWDRPDPIDLHPLIKIPGEFRTGLVACNVYYGKEIGQITFRKYLKKEIRTLRLVDSGGIDYHVKYTDRSGLDLLMSKRGECDDIVIVKNGYLADTSISNLVFFNGTDWITPEKPLLAGVTRERLLAEGRIRTGNIRVTDLDQYMGCKLINAMRYPEEETLIPVRSVFR